MLLRVGARLGGASVDAAGAGAGDGKESLDLGLDLHLAHVEIA